MANALGTLFGDIANAIRMKTGKEATMKPIEFPSEILNIVGGSSNIRATGGFITTSAENVNNGIATFSHNLGVKPDLVVLFALDTPKVTSSDPFYFMGMVAPSNAVAAKILEVNPDANGFSFAYAKSYSAGDSTKDYIWTQLAYAGYEQLLTGTGGLYTTFTTIRDITENTIVVGKEVNEASHMAMKIGRTFFYFAIGNIL